MHSPEVLAFRIKSPFWHTVKNPHGKKRRFHNSIIEIWHIEPNGADSLTVCSNKVYDNDGKFVKYNRSWKWHINHWQISPTLLYTWRRFLFTRCASCGGPSRKGNMVNHSNGGWYGNPKTPLWCGEIGLYHSECLSKVTNGLRSQIHGHVKEKCWTCVGKDAFKIKKGVNVIPELNEKMPYSQRNAISTINTSINLGLLKQSAGVKKYADMKKQAEWID